MGRRGGEKRARKARRQARKAPAPAPAAPAPVGPPSRHDALAAAALTLLLAAAYLPAFQAGFVWDDRIFTEARAVRDWSGLWRIWFQPREIVNEAHYWPLVYSTFWLEHKLWGFAPFGYHAVNVLLHAVNTLLLWRLARRLRLPGAWLLAALFAVHPLHVESVAWAIERKDLLSALFYLAAFLAWLRCAEAPDGGRKHYLLALGLFVAGLLCKSIVVTLPLALALCHWWQHGRLRAGDLARLAPFAAVGAAIVLADTAYASSREPLALGWTLAERVLIASQALWFYAGKLLWPVGLIVIYPHWPVDASDPLAWGWPVALLALLAVLWLLRGRLGRGPLAGVLFFAVTLSPVLGFVDYGYMQFSFVADRYQYLAGIGLLAVASGAAAVAAGALAPPWRRGAAVAGAVAIAILAVLTFRQAELYRDEETFFSHIVAHNPAARGAQGNLGKALLDTGRPQEALDAFRAVLERVPDDTDVLANAGVALIRTGRPGQAETLLRRALALDPQHRIVLQNLAESLRKQGSFEEALAYYRAAIEVDAGNALAYAGMGDALLRLERHQEALRNFERALALDPGLDQVRSLRRSALAHLGREDDR